MGKTTRRGLIGSVAALPLASTARAAESKMRSPATSKMPDTTIAPWVLTCAQMPLPNYGAAKTIEDTRAVLAKSMEGYEKQIVLAMERRSDLILFPENMLGGPGDDMRGVLDFPGPEIEQVQKLAQKHKVFIGGHAYTRDARFPGRYFNTSFLLDRSGNVALKYYRIHTYHSYSPHDFWDKFLDTVGLEGAFPVARTELGNIAMMPSMELMFPELARMFTLRGMEVLLHDTGEALCDVSVKRTRAAENLIYLASTNGTYAIGKKSMKVGSRIVDWEGEVLAEVADGASGQCAAYIDVESLRKRRANPDIIEPQSRGLTDVNYLSRMRVEICRDIYNAVSMYPVNTYLEGGDPAKSRITPEVNAPKLNLAVKRMADAGLIPAKYVKG